jgi:acetyltransferase-like isoleucine patch superfamily enzyme
MKSGSANPLKPLLRFVKIYVKSLLQLGLTLLGYVPSHALRKAGLRICGAKIASNALVYHGLWIWSPWKLTIGKSSIVGDHAILDARGGLTLGENVNISTNVAIWTGQHDCQSPDFAYEEAPVRICDRAWLSFRSTILPGVTVGEGAVVAACAVVTKDVSPFTIVAGIPAEVIGTRNRNLGYDLRKDNNHIRFI